MSLQANAGAIWLAVAVAYVLAQPTWDYVALWTGRWPARPRAWVEAARREPHGAWLRTVCRVLYCLGIPYVSLLLGVADARRLGVAGLPLWPQLPLGSLVGLGGLLLLVWTWRRAGAAMHRRGSRYRLLLEPWGVLHSPGGWAQLALEVLCLQASWAFVRGAVIGVLGLYAGVFVALALTAAVWLLRPGKAESLIDPEQRAESLLTAGLAVLTALVFLHAENLWLCALVHALALLAALLSAGRAYAHEFA